ncbi:MAG: DUF29 domain-containing protein [Snowella sp.]|nr:DUF29 domain-containing protein [Snowella sp.]
MEKTVTEYDQDFLIWTQKQAEYLRKGHWEQLDVNHLIEELEALGRSEQREFSSYFQRLVMHLLKWDYQPERRTASWEITIANCRDKIQDCLEDTPSLRRFLEDQDWIEKYYKRSRRDAAKETKQPIESFPNYFPYTIEQVLDPEFLA